MAKKGAGIPLLLGAGALLLLATGSKKSGSKKTTPSGGGKSPTPKPEGEKVGPEGDVPKPKDEEPGAGNPAAIYCVDQGGSYQIRASSSGGQSGFCVFPDGREVEAWAFLRGDAEPRMPGAPDPAVQNCISSGGRIAGDLCLFPDGSAVDYEAFYKGEAEPQLPETPPGNGGGNGNGGQTDPSQQEFSEKSAPGYFPPTSVPDDALYIATNCSGWAMGKNFTPRLYTGGKFVSPTELHGQYFPDEDPVNTFARYPAPSAADFMAESIIKQWGNKSGAICVAALPSVSNYSTPEDYLDAWIDYAKEWPEIVDLFLYLRERIAVEMLQSLADNNPNVYEDAYYRIYADEALAYNWDKGIDFITDQAYYAAWSDAPQTITDPNSSWAKKWNKMLNYVNDMRTEWVNFPRDYLPTWGTVLAAAEQSEGNS